MNKYLLIIIIITCLLPLTACNKKANNESLPVSTINENIKVEYLKVTINDITYNLDLEDNKTAKEFIKLLPNEFNMKDLNDNEKYIYLEKNLSTNSSNPKHIKAGDVMIYGDNCLVIFYKSFDTSYSYTKIGHINNLPNIGNDNVKVRIEY